MISLHSSHAKRTLVSAPRAIVRSVKAVLCCSIPLLLLLLVLPSALHAQLYTGSVSGVVTDPSGATVPGAKVTLVDQNKGFSFTATSDSGGRYLIRSVPPGTYSISIEATHFQTQKQDGINVDVTQNVSIDFKLSLGSTLDTVEVTASSVHLQTEDAVTGQVVNRKFISDLPLINRDFTDLTYLAPGVVETSTTTSQNKNAQGGINFNSNGSRNATADLLLDGASASNFDQNSGIRNVPYTPSVDSVEEFKVQQSNFTAEYGFSGGTIINVITRSGTNSYHGSAYEYFRNSAIDANGWFNNANAQPIPALRRNQFGATFGGPIRKDKTFFFVDYEGIRANTANSSGPIGVPSLCERGQGPCPAGQNALGNFSELCTLSGGTFNAAGMCSNPEAQLWDPYSGVFTTGLGNDPQGNSLPDGAVRQKFVPFNDLSSYSNCGIPSIVNSLNGTPFQVPQGPGCLINPVAAKLLLLFPQPNIPFNSIAALQNGNFISSGVDTTTQDQFDIKVDQRFSDKDLLSVRYSQERNNGTSFNSFGNFADPQTSGPSHFTAHLLSINHAHTFSPTTVLTITFGYVRRFDNDPGVAGQFPTINSAFTQLGFPSYLNNGFGTLPAISLNNYSSNSGTNIGTNPFTITKEGQDSAHLTGAVSRLFGRHEFKFGAEGRLYRINHVNPGWPSGFFNFDSTSTSQIATETNTDPNSGLPILGGDALASFLTGVGSPNLSGGSGCTPCQQGFNNFVSSQSFSYAGFFQDNFKVTPKLTLNLGMRYELNTPRTERFNRLSALNPTAPSPLQLTPAQIAVAQADGVSGPALQTLGSLVGIPTFASGNSRYDYPYDFTNIQPRFGLAYQLPHSFVIRGGYGIYFSSPRSGAAGSGPIAGYEGFNIQPAWLTTLNIDHVTPYNTLSNTSCAFSAPFTCTVAPAPGSSQGAFTDLGGGPAGPIFSLNKNTPYEQAWSFGFQKQVPGNVLLDVSYVGKKGTHLYFGGYQNLDLLPFSDVQGQTPAQLSNLDNLVANPFFFNQAANPGQVCNPTHFICNGAVGALASPTVQLFQLLLPFPQYNLFEGDSFPIADSIYHALQVRAEKEFSNGLQFLVTYVWSKSIDDASATDGSTVFLGGGNGSNTLNVQNPFDLRAERSVSVYDIPQVFQATYVYELPVGRGRQFGRNMNGILNAIVGGWQTNGIVRIDNGRPIIPLESGGTSIPTYGQRPTLTGVLQRASGAPENFTTSGGPSYFANPSVISVSQNFTFGNAPRAITSVRQPGARDVSMSIFKAFSLASLHEGMNLQLRCETFNTFNHPHFNGPNSSVGDPNFGVITSTLNSAREVQLALRLSF